MSAMRRYARAVAMTWLLCQVASLSAFVPEQCCVSHAAEEAARAVKVGSEACHETPAPEPKDGDACPMHHGRPRSHDCCVITNACDGPGTHLLTLFAFNGPPEPPSSSSVVLESVAATASPAPPLLYQLSIPDAPPPKA